MEVFYANISNSLVATNLKLQEDLEAEKAEYKKISKINDALIAKFNIQKKQVERMNDEFNLERQKHKNEVDLAKKIEKSKFYYALEWISMFLDDHYLFWEMNNFELALQSLIGLESLESLDNTVSNFAYTLRKENISTDSEMVKIFVQNIMAYKNSLTQTITAKDAEIDKEMFRQAAFHKFVGTVCLLIDDAVEKFKTGFSLKPKEFQDNFLQFEDIRPCEKETLQKLYESIAKALKFLQDQKDNLQKENSLMKNRDLRMVREINKLHLDIEKQEKEYEILQEHNVNLTYKLTTLLADEDSNKSKDLEKLRRANRTSQTKIDNQRTEINRLNALIKQQKEKLEDFENDFENFQKEKEYLYSKLSLLEDENSKLKTTNSETTEIISELQNTCEKLNSELEESKNESEKLKYQTEDVPNNRSMVDIARSLMAGMSSLVDKELGTSNAGNLLLEESVTQIEALKREISEMKECKICNELFDNDKHHPVKAKCGHVYYCRACLTSIAGEKKGKCPICRMPFTKKDIVAINLNFV